MASTWSPARPTTLFPIVFSPAKEAIWSGRVTRTTGQPAPARSRSRCMNAVIGADEAWYTEKPRRLRVGRAGTGFPPLGTRVRVGVERGDHDATRHDWRRTQIQGRLRTRRGAAHHHNASRVIHVNPATLFVPLNRVARERIVPGLFESLLHHQIVHEIRGCRCLHSPFRSTAIPETDSLPLRLPEGAVNFKRRPNRG